MPELASPHWLSLVLTSSAVSTVVSITVGMVRDSIKDRAGRKREARYLALRLAVRLESYMLDCLDHYQETRLHETSHGHAGRKLYRLSDLGSFDPDADWRSLDPDVAEQVLSFPNMVRLANRKIEGRIEFEEEEDTLAESSAQAAIIGIRALDIAQRLRAKHDLPAASGFGNLTKQIDQMRAFAATVAMEDGI